MCSRKKRAGPPGSPRGRLSTCARAGGGPAPPSCFERGGGTVRALAAIHSRTAFMGRPATPSCRSSSRAWTRPRWLRRRSVETGNRSLRSGVGLQEHRRRQAVSGAEKRRLEEDARRVRNWKRWGPYLSERQWGTVREDYSPNGECWDYFSHDQARSRAYRWGEDGLLGICDRGCRLCFALAL